MSEWTKIREEFGDSQHRVIRLKYMKQLCKITERNLVIYVTDFVSGSRPSALTSLSPDDKNFFADTIRGLDKSKGIDVLIESPGGLAEVAEAIADMLWANFPSVRFIVPNMCKSAGTILCLSGEKILMSDQSELGPIDPQMPVRQPNGEIKYSPAHLIIQQFQTLLGTITSQQQIGPILAPYLQIYFPALLQECQNAIVLSQTIAEELAEKYMLKNDPDKKKKAKKIGEELAKFENFLSHSRTINIDKAKSFDLKDHIYDLKEDKELYDAVNVLYLSIRETFNRNPQIAKICENHLGHGTTLNFAVR